MKINLFKKKYKSLQEEWFNLGEKYSKDINKMVEYGETHGWDKWKGKTPKDLRDHLSDEIIHKLKEANCNNTVNEFREKYPPAHEPFIKYFQKQGQCIEHMHFIEKEKIVFVIGTAYQKRQAFILEDQRLIALDHEIQAIGKSKKNNIFAIKKQNTIITTNGWDGEIITTFKIKEEMNIGITKLIPFNDGKQVLSITSEGIFLITKESMKMIHPEIDLEDEEWSPEIDMENGTLSNDNKYIVVGDQCSDHRVLDDEGNEIGTIGPQSEYPHFCMFSEDDSQLITNSCHFYNGVTIGVDGKSLNGIKIEAWEDNDIYTILDEDMRIYEGIYINSYYILGDAHGYIKAINKNGKCLWRHFLGSTISGITSSDNGRSLWVATYAGIIHKLIIDKGLRDTHTIGNSNNYEEFRLIMWKGEDKELFW